ncbi:YpoC family protein [Neobacillus niacini]|uniref:YpoC family protein n=1 Tax=Neobacillus niacini TaxID=86668 RepID=UPI0028671355|nr:hypothetical protein [Neobacillus niacini]MDR6998513.1 hypothetical protein [Neobacillus niacini]
MDKRIDFEKPWEKPSEVVPILLLEWGNLKEDLERFYSIRDQENTNLGMKKGIDLFLKFLFWSNERPIADKEPLPLDSLEYKPVNIGERLGFILKRPNLFHSYRQLSELFLEQEKLFVKKNIMKKASKP